MEPPEKDLKKLLKFDNDIGFKVRFVDTIIHRWNDGQKRFDIQSHLEHQQFLWNNYGENEHYAKRIFNGRVYSNDGSCGILTKTKTMTAILRACYFTLYYNLIKTHNLRFDIFSDYPILLKLLFEMK